MEHFRTKRLTHSLVLLCLLILALSACRGNEQSLSGEYKLFFMSGREIRIARADKYVDHKPSLTVMLPGNVKQYAVRDPYITGYADTQYLDLSLEPDARSGYFLIDTKSDKIVAYGMDQDRWEKELAKIGWSNPDLKRPGGWF